MNVHSIIRQLIEGRGVGVLTTFFLVMIHLPYVSASEDVVLKKYSYGFRQFSQVKGEKYLPPVVESLFDTSLKGKNSVNNIHPYYDVGDYESKIEKNKHHIDIHLTVHQRNTSVLATVIFYNSGQQAYFVHRSRLATKESFFPLCGHAFSIATNGISLAYLGRRCQFEDEDNDEKPDWVKIPAGERFSYTAKLSDVYSFLPGKRRYNIGTLKFFMANDTLFYEKRIFKRIFSILNWKFEKCETNKYSYFFEKINELCGVNAPWNEDTAEGLLRKFNYDGFSPSGYFEARSNQVVIEIDGDNLTSPYDMDTTRFSN